MTTRAKVLGLICLIACCMGLVSMFVGAYLHDVHHALTRDQVFIAPFACLLVALLALVLGWIEEERRHG